MDRELSDVLADRTDADLAERSRSGSVSYVVLATILLATTPMLKLDPIKGIGFGLGTLFLAIVRGLVVARRRPGWRSAFDLTTLGVALLWGELGAVVLEMHGMADTALLVLLCNAGVTAGAVSALAPARRLQVIYVLALLAPTLITLAFQPRTPTVYGLIAMLGCFLLYMLLQGERVHHEYVRSIETAHRLELVNEELAAASRAKSAFLADMSHELRTPMTAIRGFSDLLLDGELDATDREYVGTIVRNCDHLLAIINDILDLARVESGKTRIDLASTAPGQIALDVEALLGERAVAKGIELVARADGPIPAFIPTDALRVKQILVNLVANAIRHTDRGRVTLAVSVDEREGCVPHLQYTISDTGDGMSPEQLTRLFQPFGQVDASPARREGGTGLGLVISRKLADALGGYLVIGSTPGEGTTVTLSLPSGPLEGVRRWRGLRGAEPARDAAAGIATGRLHGRVLVAEDDPDLSRLIRAQLEHAGATVELCADGAAAASRAMAAVEEGDPFQLILMDMRMPRMDGYSATRALRAAGYLRPIVALTAQAMHGDRERCLDAGCDDFLIKPIEGRQLLEVVGARLALTR